MPETDINKARVLGEISDEPQAKVLSNSVEVCNLNIKTVYEYNGKECPQWHKIVLWRELAEQCHDLKAGDRVQVDGRLQTRVWENKDGVKQKTTEIVATTITVKESAPVAPPETQPADSEDLPF